jgi:hypothetical protein
VHMYSTYERGKNSAPLTERIFISFVPSVVLMVDEAKQ